MSRSAQRRDILVIPLDLVTRATDSTALGEHVRLYEVADASWPNPAPVPRWADQGRLVALAVDGSIILHDGDRFTVAAVDQNRLRQEEWHRLGGKARSEKAQRDGGRFTSNHQQAPATAGNSPADVDGDDDDDVETPRHPPRDVGPEEVYLAIVGVRPREAAAQWLGELAEGHGIPALEAALRDEWDHDKARKSLLGRTQARLEGRERTVRDGRRFAASRRAIETMPSYEANLAYYRNGSTRALTGLGHAEDQGADQNGNVGVQVRTSLSPSLREQGVSHA